jgi:anti-sigma B factor antagonist
VRGVVWGVDLAIDLTIDPPTATLATQGELDIFSARDLAVSLRDAMTLGCSRIVIDVAGVSFVDASALGVLARLKAVLDADGGTMEFGAVSPRFQRLCSIARLDGLFGLSGEWTPGGGTPSRHPRDFETDVRAAGART